MVCSVDLNFDLYISDAQEAAKAAAQMQSMQVTEGDLPIDPIAYPGAAVGSVDGTRDLAAAVSQTGSGPSPPSDPQVPGTPSQLVASGPITTSLPTSTVVPPPNITEEEVVKAVMDNLDDQKYYAKMALLGVIGQGIFYLSLGLIGVGAEHKWCTLFFAVIALVGDIVCLFRLQFAFLVILAFIFNVVQTVLAFYYFDRLNCKQSLRDPVSTNLELM